MAEVYLTDACDEPEAEERDPEREISPESGTTPPNPTHSCRNHKKVTKFDRTPREKVFRGGRKVSSPASPELLLGRPPGKRAQRTGGWWRRRPILRPHIVAVVKAAPQTA